jgi:dTDP-4-amino-4,6-dideoxygalactose transaminase
MPATVAASDRQAMKVPLLDLGPQHAPIRSELLSALARVVDSSAFILGPEVDRLEGELAALLEVGHAIGVSSGTDALLAALMTLGVGPGDDVIVPAYSFFATAGSVARLGARPVMVDIDAATFNINACAAVAALTPRTRAVMPVHLFGQAADLDVIEARLAPRGIPVLEDAAQAIGARFGGRQVGGIGVAGCFSFYPTKNLGAFGDAGLVTTNDAGFAARLREVRNHGEDARYRHRVVGGNFRLDAMQAAVLGVKAPHLARWSDERRANAARYRGLFEERGLTDRVTLPVQQPGRSHIFNQYVVRVPRRDELGAHLARQGVGTAVYYPIPLHRQPCFEALGYREGAFPESERAARESLALPIYPGLTIDQQAYVVSAIASFFQTS